MKVTHKLAVLAAALTVGSAAQAQSSDSSVTLYGIVDIGVGVQNVSVRGESASKVGVQSSKALPSIWGIRGKEDLGNGNYAVFKLEGGFDPGTGFQVQGGRLWGRNSTIGLGNLAYGQVDLGRQANIATRYFTSIDPFGLPYSQFGMGQSFGAMNQTIYNNMLVYQTPTYAGFSGGIGYSFATGMDTLVNGAGPGSIVDLGSNQQFATSNNMRALTLGAQYVNGPAKAVLTYDQVAPSEALGNGNAPTVKSWNIGGSYDFNVVKVSAAYGQTREGWIAGALPARRDVNTSWANGGVLFQNGTGANSYMLGATVPVSASGRVLASWNMATPNGNWSDAGAKSQTAYNLGYIYDFSKRTSAYVYGSYVNNYAMVDTAKSTMVTVGMNHKF